METGVLSKGLDVRTKKEIERGGPKSFFSNRINIARTYPDPPPKMLEELHWVMDNLELDKEGLIAIFDGQGDLVDFIEQHL